MNELDLKIELNHLHGWISCSAVVDQGTDT